MISKAYEKADFKIIEYTLEDVITRSSAVVHTTSSSATTTLPGTTIPVHDNSGGDIHFDYEDFFK